MTFMILYVMILWFGWISWGTEHSPCGVSTTLQLVSCLTGFAIRPDKEICSYLCAVKLLSPYRSSWKQAVKLNFSPQWVLSGHCCQCNRFKVTYYQISSEFSPQWKKKNPVKCNMAPKKLLPRHHRQCRVLYCTYQMWYVNGIAIWWLLWHYLKLCQLNSQVP